jgi:hypothetical protein
VRHLRLPAVAASLLAAGGIAAAAPAALAARAPAATWHVAYRGPVGTEIDGITAPARTDGWAFGFVYGKHGVPVRFLYLHWNGHAWRPVMISSATGFVPVQIASSSPDDVWIVGENSKGTIGEALVYNGSGWKKITAPWPGSQLDVASSTDVWMVEGDTGCGQGHACTTILDHWNGAGWLAYPFAAQLGLAGGSARPWLAGTASGTARRELVYRWNGSSWRRHAAPGGSAVQLVAVSSPGGRLWVATQARNRGPWRLYEVDAATWSRLSTPRSFRPSAVGAWPVYDGRNGFWDTPYHWTGTRWVATVSFAPSKPSWLNCFWYQYAAAIPGTSSVWAAVLVNTDRADGATPGAIAYYGARP